jgi:predicted amidohydrolase YtcJ
MNHADIILRGSAIFTGIEDQPMAGAVAIVGNKISGVFRQGEDVAGLTGPATNIIDCGDKLVMPGFIDAHTHVFHGATAASDHMCTEIYDSTSEADCIRIIKAFADSHPNEPRILGIGWFPAFWGDAPLPSKKSLDAAIPDRPAYLSCADGHTMWTNSLGLKECGINRDTQVAYGEIQLGEDGEPTGILIENDAMKNAVIKQFLFPEAVALPMYRDFLKQIAASGITSLCDMNASELNADTAQLFGYLKKLEDEGDLTARLHLYSDLVTISKGAKAEKEMASKLASPKLKYNGLKAFIDGVTSTYTGFMLEPYSDRPDTVGNANYPKEVYADATKVANSEGFPVRFHSIGDAAVRWALDIFEGANDVRGDHANQAGLRNSVEHIESIHPEDIPRFAELGVIASLQPYHLTLDANEKLVRIGPARCRWEWPLRTFLDTGTRMAHSTDYPVVDFNPFKNIYAAISRCDDDGKPTGVNPEEVITLTEALKLYTVGSAYAIGREKDLGTLETGKLADIVVADRNLFEISPFELNDCQVFLTIFDGKEVYRAE